MRFTPFSNNKGVYFLSEYAIFKKYKKRQLKKTKKWEKQKFYQEN
jgi:hypothetical protein